MSQMSLMSGPERRRRWSEDQKKALVAAAFSPGANVAEVARMADIGTGLLYRWRQVMGCGEGVAAFAPAVLMTTDQGLPQESKIGANRSILVEFRSGARVQFGADASPSLATAILKALQP